MIPDMIHTPYIVPRISVMAPPPVTAERFVDELLSGLRMPDGGFVAHLAPSGDPFSNGWNAAMKLQASQPASRRLPMPVNVIFHTPAILRILQSSEHFRLISHPLAFVGKPLNGTRVPSTKSSLRSGTFFRSGKRLATIIFM